MSLKKGLTFLSLFHNGSDEFPFHHLLVRKQIHVFVFEPTNDGKGTHLIHYEIMKGMLSPFLMTKKVKANMSELYKVMNQDFKNICEK